MKKTIVGNEYFELVRRFPLRPIRSERELDNAIAVIDDLIARLARSAEADDYLDVLSDLVEKYESEHHRTRRGANAQQRRSGQPPPSVKMPVARPPLQKNAPWI